MRSLETTWKGYRFRSRTEARWAVFLSAAGIAFEYEHQGYDLPSGWYLPDFWLPERKQWLEIKGEQPTKREIALAIELARHTGSWVLFGVGAPSPDNTELPVAMADGFDGVVTLEGPAAAYAAARAERFDGKPEAAKTSPKQRWW